MMESYRELPKVEHEEEPSLPDDPEEAGVWLEEIWKGSGGWESQHPLKLGVKGPEDYQALPDEERAKFDKLGSEYAWLAQMYQSELLWSQSYTRTNYGEVIGFRFGYDTPENPEENIPDAYIFRSFDQNQPEMFVSKGRDGWTMKPLSELADAYAENFGY